MKGIGVRGLARRVVVVGYRKALRVCAQGGFMMERTVWQTCTRGRERESELCGGGVGGGGGKTTNRWKRWYGGEV